MKISGSKILNSILLCTALLTAPGHGLSAERHELTVQDLAYGLSLYQFYQNKPLLAITELDVGKAKNALTRQPDDAELLLGGLYFNYGLANEAESIFNQLLQDKTEAQTQNRIWFNLARVQYDQGHFDQALELLTRIDAELPSQREDQKQHLLTNLYIRNQQYDLASEAVKQIKGDSVWRPYSEYNLGVALAGSDNSEQGKDWLKKVTTYPSTDQEILALLDSTHLALGLSALKQQKSEEAIDSFIKIRLSGPLSNKALLGIGWAWSLKSASDQALNYWLSLRNKQQIDGATQEAILAIPYAIEQKGDKTLAAQYYSKAASSYDDLLVQMDLIIGYIQQNKLINSLHQNRLVVDESRSFDEPQSLQSLTTAYLNQLFASSEFELEVRHYQELLDIQSSLTRWQNNLPVLQLMLEERKLSFEQKRPLVESSTSFEELQALKGQRDQFSDIVNTIEQTQDYLALAFEDEVDYLDQLEEIQNSFAILEGNQNFSEEQVKFRLLSGLIHYQISIDFPRRFWSVKRELELLDRSLLQASSSAQSLSQAAELNEVRLEDFSQRIEGQNEEINLQVKKVTQLIDQQQQHINSLAISEVEAQKVHVKQLRLSARYSLARLYDEISSQGKLP